MQSGGRNEVLKMLSSAASRATAGELQRAVQFLEFARDVRMGKHDLRRKGRQDAASRNRDYNKRSAS